MRKRKSRSASASFFFFSSRPASWNLTRCIEILVYTQTDVTPACTYASFAEVSREWKTLLSLYSQNKIPFSAAPAAPISNPEKPHGAKNPKINLQLLVPGFFGCWRAWPGRTNSAGAATRTPEGARPCPARGFVCRGGEKTSEKVFTGESVQLGIPLRKRAVLAWLNQPADWVSGRKTHPAEHNLLKAGGFEAGNLVSVLLLLKNLIKHY